MEPSQLVDAVRKLAKVSHALAPADKVLCTRIARVSEAYMRHGIERSIAAQPKNAVLTVYINDAWGAYLNTTQQIRSGEHLVRYRGKWRHEMLLERGLVFIMEDTGSISKFMLVTPPKGLRLGKKALNVFTATNEFWDHPRILGHTGIVVSVYVQDGALFEACA